MSFRTLCTIAAVLSTVFGLGFLFAPAAVLAQYAVSTDAAGIFMTRFFAATLIQFGLVFFAIRELPAGMIPKVSVGIAIGELAGLWVAVSIQLGGHVNAMGWSTVAIYGFFAIGFGLLAFRKA